MTEEQKVEILLHEYDTFRDEILQRTSHMYQLIEIGFGLLSGGLFAWAISGLTFCAFLKLFVGLGTVLFVLNYIIHIDIYRAAVKIQHFECGHVNREEDGASSKPRSGWWW